jgi:hypothetical protein
VVKTCVDNGEKADFWLETRPGDTDKQKMGILLFSLLRGLSSAMKGKRRGGASCDIHPKSLISLIGEAKGIAVGPVIYASNCCSASPSGFLEGPRDEGP